MVQNEVNKYQSICRTGVAVNNSLQYSYMLTKQPAHENISSIICNDYVVNFIIRALTDNKQQLF